MADTKITALTALTGADPANDVIPIVDVSDTTMAASGTTKKISVNNILGASGTATLASATITGDLTVRTNKLKVTSIGVGAGTTTPAAILHSTQTTSYDALILDSDSASTYCTANWRVGGVQKAQAYLDVADDALLIRTNTATGPLKFGCNNIIQHRIDPLGVFTWYDGAGGTRMTLNSTGLGVGDTATVSRLQVRGSTSDSTSHVFYGRNSGGNVIMFMRNDGRFVVGSGTVDNLIVTETGNVGIGVTPSAWSQGKAIETGFLGNALWGAAQAQVIVSRNAYFNAGWKYAYTGATASNYEQGSGGHLWYTAPSGTAGNAITFTQAMTLTASGNLAVGVAATGNRLDVQNSTDCTVLVKSTGANANVALDYISNYGNHTIRKSGTAVWDFGVINDASATPAFKVSNASAVGVQLVSGATSWTTLSDETTKDIIEPISNAVAKVGSLRSVIGKFKTDESSKRRSFLIAQDVQSVLPEAVDVIGENNELGLRYTEVIPLLVAAIKELTARVQTLETR